MPSLRQPVGPLPASIYWRRRLVVLVAALAVAGVVGWLAFGSDGNGSDRKNSAQGSPLPAPAQSITPGASPTGSAITTRPGGTGGGSVSGGGGGEVSLTNGGTGTGSGGTNPSAGSGGSASPAGSGGGSGAAGGAGGAAAGGTGGGAPAVNTAEVMALPVCTASQLSLELASAQNAYQPKDRPRLALTVRNTSGSACRVDLGRAASTLTVTSSAGERIWSSGDCPTDRSATWAQIAGNNGLTETFNWDRTRSKPQCASADPAAAQPGNYLIQADLTGPAGGPLSARTSVRLDA
ncbi:hypothetical protein AB0K51_34100 [Kitasatospora sp. NPDC049285]|uniref:hypothetical protein n=1 Tax=Kitasatospora sp. NPDC049285 TaxID=3157096 RepID=UPI0034142F09